MSIRRVLKALALCRDPSLRWGLRHGVGGAIEHRAVLASIRPDLIIDVGANKGQFSLIARAVHPNVPIIAFEPLESESLKFGSLFNSDPGVRLVRAAVGPNEGEGVLHRSRKADCSSLLPIAARQSEIFPGTQEVGQEKVQIVSLPDAVGHDIQGCDRALLKVDVQGFELQVLLSADPILRHVRWVYCEASFSELYEGQALAHDIIAQMANADFVLIGVYNLSLDGSGVAIQADFLFENTLQPTSQHTAGAPLRG